jgi:3-oxoacyl-[acyl-carrier protein] reductase
MSTQKLVIVTGGTKGLGFGIVSLLLEEGYKVVCVGRSKPERVDGLENKFPESFYYEKFDFSEVEKIREFCKVLSKNYGRAYGLVNNAALGHDGVLATMHESDISQLIKVNVEAPILLTKYLIRGMLIEQQGRIINISSIIASTGFNGLSVYGATKAALAGFTKSLCREVGKANITVNTIAPGYMETDMTSSLQGEKLASIKRRSPLGKLASVNDVAKGVMFLMNENSSLITGTTLTIDGGSTA